VDTRILETVCPSCPWHAQLHEATVQRTGPVCGFRENVQTPGREHCGDTPAPKHASGSRRRMKALDVDAWLAGLTHCLMTTAHGGCRLNWTCSGPCRRPSQFIVKSVAVRLRVWLVAERLPRNREALSSSPVPPRTKGEHHG
jgi:hypothetical protein